MAVYEDDPRTKPKLQRYGGSTSRSSAGRGEPKKSHGATESKAKKEPRLPAAPKQRGKDRLDFDTLPRTPVEQPQHFKNLQEASPYIDVAIRELMKAASPGSAAMERKDRKGQSRPKLSDWLRAAQEGWRMKDWKTQNKDKGIHGRATPVAPRDQMPKVRMGALPEWNGET